MAATNESRATWAETAITQFRADTGTDKEDAICDLVGDLMHLADRYGQDPLREIQRGIQHFLAEKEDGDDDDGLGALFRAHITTSRIE